MPGVDVVRKIFYTLLFACLAQSSLSDSLIGKIYILGNIDDDKKITVRFHNQLPDEPYLAMSEIDPILAASSAVDS